MTEFIASRSFLFVCNHHIPNPTTSSQDIPRTFYKASSVRRRRYSGDSTCEHVSFNSGLKMFINPCFISGGEPLEHLP